jgi:hypothetical protein
MESALELAVAARVDAFEMIVAVLADAEKTDDLDHWLRRLHDDDSARFQVVSAVAAGAYLMLPQIRTVIGYSHPHRSVAGLDESAEQLGDGILDPVLKRGPIYVSAQ